MTKESLLEMADARGEIAYTSNTRNVLDQAVTQGLVEPVPGKFRQVEIGCFNSIYRVL